MDPVVTSAGMKKADRAAGRRLGVASSLLMENAGREIALAARSMLARRTGPVLIVCGKGNNGGDGFVAARHLLAAGVPVVVVLVGRAAALRGDARGGFHVLRKMGRGSSAGAGDAALRVVIDPAGKALSRAPRPAIIVDALVGTGFRGDLRGGVLAAVEWINRGRAPVLSVDVPTGLDADDGIVGNACVRAARTVTMGYLKRGMLLGRGPEVCGKITVAGLGVKMPLPSGGDAAYRVSPGDVRAFLPDRPFDAHKHSAGKVLVIAGSKGYTGAAAMTATAAMRSGAGAVILATPVDVYPILAKKLTEVMVRPLAGGDGGYSAASAKALARDLAWADVVVVGPGMGLLPRTEEFLAELLRGPRKRPGYVIDADALTILGRNAALRKTLRAGPCVLTPHAGEFSRVSGVPPGDLLRKRSDRARRFAAAHGVTLVLKGAPTLTVSRQGTLFVNATGNRGMASAGMGDVLAGMIAAFWAESGDPVGSSWAAAHIHGEAGDEAAARQGYRSLMAGDLLKLIPKVLQKYEC